MDIVRFLRPHDRDGIPVSFSCALAVALKEPLLSPKYTILNLSSKQAIQSKAG